MKVIVQPCACILVFLQVRGPRACDCSDLKGRIPFPLVVIIEAGG